jgi:hypothetical protein
LLEVGFQGPHATISQSGSDMMFAIEFFRIRESDNAHASLIGLRTSRLIWRVQR